MHPHTVSARLKTFLLLLPLSALILISGCDVVGPEDPVVGPEKPGQPEALTVSFVDGSTGEREPGAFVAIAVGNVPYGTSVSGRLGEKEIVLAELQRDTLAFFIPALAPGSHSLVLEAAERSGQAELRIAFYQEIEDPDTYVAELVHEAVEALAALEEEEDDPEVRSFLSQMRTDMETTLGGEWATLSQDDKAVVAHALRALAQQDGSFQSGLTAHLLAGKSAGCKYYAGLFSVSVEVAMYASWVAAAIATLPVFGVASAIIGGYSGAKFFRSGKNVVSILMDIYGECGTGIDVRLITGQSGGASNMAAGKNASTSSNDLSFVHGQPHTISVETAYKMEDDAANTANKVRDVFESVKSVVPESWLEIFATLSEPDWRPGPPVGLQLGAISRSDIEGTMSVSGDNLTLEFQFSESAEPGDKPEAFSFDLETEGLTSTHSATLSSAHIIEGTYEGKLHEGHNNTISLVISHPAYDGDSFRFRWVISDASGFAEEDLGTGTYTHPTVTLVFDEQEYDDADGTVSNGGRTLTIPLPEGTLVLQRK